MELPPRRGPSRRTVLRAAAGALTGGLLAGCGSGTRAATGATRVTIWAWLTGMDRYVAAFNAAQSEVHVELSVIAAGRPARCGRGSRWSAGRSRRPGRRARRQ